MCVAAIINTRVSLEKLEMMEKQNPHGAGVAWLGEDKWGLPTVKYAKGLTAKEIYALQDKITYPFLMHYRWATHRPKVPELTHPFPLGGDALFPRLEGECDAALIHNGVWYSYAKHIPDWVKEMGIEDSLSDTQLAAFLAKENESILDDIDWSTAILRVGADGKAEIVTRGRWYKLWGNFYSNHNWLAYKDMPTNWWKADNENPPGYIKKEYLSYPGTSSSSGARGGSYAGSFYNRGSDWEGEPQGDNSEGTCWRPEKKNTTPANITYTSEKAYRADPSDYTIDPEYWFNDGRPWGERRPWIDPTKRVSPVARTTAECGEYSDGIPEEVIPEDTSKEVVQYCDACSWAIDHGYDDCGSKYCRRATRLEALRERNKARKAKEVDLEKREQSWHNNGKALSWEEYCAQRYGIPGDSLKVMDTEGEEVELTPDELEELRSLHYEVSEDPNKVNRFLQLAGGKS